MRLTPGAVRLDDILGGTLLVGTIPFPRISRGDVSTENAGAISVTSPGLQILQLALPNVVVGDRVIVVASISATKGVTAGQTFYAVQKFVGTGGIVGPHDKPAEAIQETQHPANTSWDCMLTGLFKVTVAGTLTIEVFGISSGSNAAIQIGEAQLYAWVIPGS